MYPPREYFCRIRALEDNCRKERLKDDRLRTQVRIGVNGIELHIKKIGHRWERHDPDMYGTLSEPEL